MGCSLFWATWKLFIQIDIYRLLNHKILIRSLNQRFTTFFASLTSFMLDHILWTGRRGGWLSLATAKKHLSWLVVRNHLEMSHIKNDALIDWCPRTQTAALQIKVNICLVGPHAGMAWVRETHTKSGLIAVLLSWLVCEPITVFSCLKKVLMVISVRERCSSTASKAVFYCAVYRI